MTGAVPVFVERTDGAARRFRKSHLARDVGAPLATDSDQLAGHAAATSDTHEMRNAAAQTLTCAGVPEGLDCESDFPVRVDDLHFRLDVLIVGAEQLRDACGVARAAGVFQQHRVVECRAICRAESDAVGDTHRDHAAAQRVTGGCAFRQVERV